MNSLNALPQQSLAPLFRLWQQHRLALEFYPPFLSLEKFVIHAELEMDRTTADQVEEVLHVFNMLADTQYRLDTVLNERFIRHGREREGQLEVKAQRLWWLDFGDVDFPVYATVQEEAEYIAVVMEQGREKLRNSLVLLEQRREMYPPLRILFSFTVTRTVKPTIENETADPLSSSVRE